MAESTELTPNRANSAFEIIGVNSIDSATSVEKHLIKSATIIVEKGLGQ